MYHTIVYSITFVVCFWAFSNISMFLFPLFPILFVLLGFFLILSAIKIPSKSSAVTQVYFADRFGAKWIWYAICCFAIAWFIVAIIHPSQTQTVKAITVNTSDTCYME